MECNWETGSLVLCAGLKDIIAEGYVLYNESLGKVSLDENVIEGREFDFCPRCGGDLRKPKPVFKRSGKTFVACDYSGINYIWTRRSNWDSDDELVLHGRKTGNILSGWQEISLFNMTDDIVKLLSPNVLVKGYGRQSTTIHAMMGDEIVLYDSENERFSIANEKDLVGLATVGDLA